MKRKVYKFIVSVIISCTIVLSLSVLTFADTDSDDDSSGGALVILLAGPAFYGTMSAIYSGKFKRHEHEKYTQSVIENISGSDEYIQTLKRRSESTIGTIKFSNQVVGSKMEQMFTVK